MYIYDQVLPLVVDLFTLLVRSKRPRTAERMDRSEVKITLIQKVGIIHNAIKSVRESKHLPPVTRRTPAEKNIRRRKAVTSTDFTFLRMFFY